jgi:hypothetical protein
MKYFSPFFEQQLAFEHHCAKLSIEVGEAVPF